MECFLTHLRRLRLSEKSLQFHFGFLFLLFFSRISKAELDLIPRSLQSRSPVPFQTVP